MKSLPDPSGLRISPLPYLTWQVSPEAIIWTIDSANILKREHPELKTGRIRQIRDRMLVCLAFAECFGLQEQFEQNCGIPSSFVSIRPGDFTFTAADGTEQFLAVVPSRVDVNYDNVGPSMAFFIKSKELKSSPAEVYVLAAIAIPTVHFLGWVPKSYATRCLQSWNARVLAGSSEVRPLQELPLEHLRKKGYYA